MERTYYTRVQQHRPLRGPAPSLARRQQADEHVVAVEARRSSTRACG